MASNGRYLAILRPPRLENAGWEIRVRDSNDFTTLVAVVSEWITFSISPELNASGAGSITLDLDTPFWGTKLADGRNARALRDYEFLWEAWEDGNLRFQWLGRNVEEASVGEDERRGVTFSGPGTAEVLKMARIYRPGWPKPVPKKMLNNPEFQSGTDATPAFKWIFPPKWPSMRMWYTLLVSAQRRKTIPWIKPTFTPLKDSAGADWEFIPTVANTDANLGFSPTIGQDLFDFLNDCTGQDYSTYFAEYTEWFMRPNFKLDVQKTIGAHREKKVIFYEGQIESRSRTRSREEIQNVVTVIDSQLGESNVADAASIKRWNRREMYYDQAAQVRKADRRTAVAQSVLRQYKNEKSEWSITVPATAAYRRPFYHYNIGDWIGLSNWTYTGTSNTVDAYRVQAMTVTVAGETPTVELTLQDKFAYDLAQMQKWLTIFINQAIIGVNGPSDEETNKTNATFAKDGYVDGIRVFIQPTDPGDKLARPGDLWFDTQYTAETGYVYTPSETTPTTNWVTANPYNAPKFHYYDPNKQL